jgi:hypothetical protein
VGISINLPKIGLSRWILEFKPTSKSYSQPIESALKNTGGLINCSKLIPDNSCFGLVVTPFGEESKLKEELNSLKEARVLEGYSLEEVEWFRHFSFDPTAYDFKERRWIINWDDMDKRREPLLTPYSKGGRIHVDYKDIMILKELRDKVPRTLSKLSKKLKIDQHNLRYHYKNHASLAIQGYYLKLASSPNSVNNMTIKFVYDISNERSLVEARTAANSIPFTTVAWKTESTYGWEVRCPGEFAPGLLSYVNRKFINISGRVRMVVADGNSEFRGGIPTNLFDESSNRWVYSPKIAISAVRR